MFDGARLSGAGGSACAAPVPSRVAKNVTNRKTVTSRRRGLCMPRPFHCPGSLAGHLPWRDPAAKGTTAGGRTAPRRGLLSDACSHAFRHVGWPGGELRAGPVHTPLGMLANFV